MKNEKAELTETFDFLYYEVIFRVLLLYQSNIITLP